MHAIHIDATAWVASVEAGTTAGQLTATTAAHGLVVPFGDSPTVGVGGITLGGGVGWLSRKLGLTIDSLDSVEVVTAEGQLVAADEHTRQDLFWAVRGGGGNFGVVPGSGTDSTQSVRSWGARWFCRQRTRSSGA
jgi:FAD/FMN-containing dehydrogenase